MERGLSVLMTHDLTDGKFSLRELICKYMSEAFHFFVCSTCFLKILYKEEVRESGNYPDLMEESSSLICPVSYDRRLSIRIMSQE